MLKPWQTAYLLYDQFRTSPKKPVFLAGMDDFKAYLPHLKLEKEGDEVCLFIDDAKKTAVYLQKTATAIKAVINQVPIPNEIEQFLKNKFGSNLEVNAVSATSNQNIENGDTLFAIEMLLHCANKKELPPKEINKNLSKYKLQLEEIPTTELPAHFIKNFREWQTLTDENFLPDIFTQPLYQWQLIAPATLQLKNPPDFNWKIIFKDISGVQYSMQDGTLIVTASDANTLKNAFDVLTQEKTHLNLLQQEQSQLLALSTLAEEAKELLEIAHIHREVKGGGLGMDQVNSALQYFLAPRADIKVILTPDELSKVDLTQYKYIVFAFGINVDINAAHQVAVIVDIENKKIIELDSENKDSGASVKKFFGGTELIKKFENFEIKVATPSSIQKNEWACGLHIVRNVLTYFNQQFLDNNVPESKEELRTILRASKYNDLINYVQNTTAQEVQKLRARLQALEKIIQQIAFDSETHGKLEAIVGTTINLSATAMSSNYESYQYLNDLILNETWPADLTEQFKHQKITLDVSIFRTYIEYKAIKLLLTMEEEKNQLSKQLQSKLQEKINVAAQRQIFEQYKYRQQALQSLLEKIKLGKRSSELVSQFRSLIKSDEDFEEALSQLKLNTDKENFLMFYLEQNKTVDGIKKVLKATPSNERVKRFTSFKEKLSLNEIAELLEKDLFSSWQKEIIIKDIKLQNYDFTSRLLFIEKVFPEQKRLSAFLADRYSISTVDELLQALRLFTDMETKGAAAQRIGERLIMTLPQIKLVANQLEGEAKIKFLRNFDFRAQTIPNVFQYLELFDDPEARLGFFRDFLLNSLVNDWKEDFFTKMPETLKSN